MSNEDQLSRHVAKYDRLSCRQARCRTIYGVSLLAAALQNVARHPIASPTVPGARRPEQPIADTEAMRASITDSFWQALEPLVGNFDVAIAPE
jgi:hypothetical protein